MIERRRADIQREAAPEQAEQAGPAARPGARLPLEAGNAAITRLLRHGHGPASVSDDFTGRLGAEGGHEIPDAPRQDLESGFGVPLGGVRLHTGGTAADLARQVNARAFTVGQDIYFGQGEYDPGSKDGYRLLAHEVTHTVQQSAGSPAGQQLSSLSVSSPEDQEERDAHAVADHLAAHRGTELDPVEVEDAPAVVARHDSWEHTLLGDTPPGQLSGASGTGPAVTVQARTHLLDDLWQRTNFFAQNPDGDPRAKFPNVRWIQFRNSGLWATNGELNALGDYLPDPAAADTMLRSELLPVLQKMRSMTMKMSNTQLVEGPFGVMMPADNNDAEGMATSWLEYLSEAAGDVKAIDNATAAEGTNRYQGLLSRNACHFAPFSWHRWEEYHNQALEHARLHFASRTSTVPLNSVPRDTEEHARQAILNNGYADHFLQDSFAAGHLVNKTLIMQWWVDYLNQQQASLASLGYPASGYPAAGYQLRPGAPDADVLARMGSAKQRNIAGQEYYHRPPTEGPDDDWDRVAGSGPTDPQSAQERYDRSGRESGSGVTGSSDADREANYQAYLRLLNNAQAQAAAGSVHDYFNERGLMVTNSDGSLTMTVGGDDSMLAKSSALGSWAAGTAASLSRKMIEDVLDTGTSTITFQEIFSYVPTAIVVDGKPMPLEQWQDQILHDLCFSKIFPDYYSTFKAGIIGDFSSSMVDGGMSQDSGKAPPPKPPVGDFPMPSGANKIG